jgi:hypothetical protein
MIREAQKFSNQIATNLITDGWETEAIEFMESTKGFHSSISKELDKPDQFFKHEM